MDTPTIILSPREVTGKKVKNLRKQGYVPVHFYGRDVESLALQVELKPLRKVIAAAGANVPIKVTIEGRDAEDICFLREAQRHPVSEELLHIDFYRVDVTRMVRAEVPVILDGEAPAVRNMGGVLLQPLSTLEVEALPLDMPASFQIDVTGLEDFEGAVRIGDIHLSEGVTILREDDEVLARVSAPRVEDEPEDEELGDELGEGEVPEGEEGDEGGPQESGDEDPA